MLCSFLTSSLQGEREIRRRDGLNQGGKHSQYSPSGFRDRSGRYGEQQHYMLLPGIEHRITSSSTSHSIIQNKFVDLNLKSTQYDTLFTEFGLLLNWLPFTWIKPITFFTFKWPCIVTNFFWIKPTDPLISQIYFCQTTLHVSTTLVAILREVYYRGWIHLFHSFSSLSYDRSKASSKASSPYSAI
jgi:hypothetical protein